MSDLWLLDTPRTPAGVTADKLHLLADAPVTPFSTFMEQSGAAVLHNTGLGELDAWARSAHADSLARLRNSPEAAPLGEADWRAGPYFREGMAYDPGTTLARARVRAEIHDETAYRDMLIVNRRPNVVESILGFAAGVIGGLPSPENFIPFMGPALHMARAGRLGLMLARGAERVATVGAGGLGARVMVGATIGAADAVLGNLAIMPLTIPSRQYYGEDIGWAEIIQDLALGAAAGAVLGGGFGALRGRAVRPPPGDDLPAPGIPTQDAALHALTAASADMAQGRPLDLAALPDNARAALVAARGRQMAAWIEVPDPAHTDMQAAALAFVQREAAAGGAPGVAIPNRGFSYGFLDAAEVRRLRDLDLRLPWGPARIVDGAAVRHILRDHGPAASRPLGEDAVTLELIARYPELIRTPVDVAPTVTDRGLPSVTYLLRDVDGSLVVVEELRRRVGVMALRTMFRMPRNWGGTRVRQVPGVMRRVVGGMDQASPSSTSETGTLSRRGLDVTAPGPDQTSPSSTSGTTAAFRGALDDAGPDPSIARAAGGFHLFPDDVPADFSRAAQPDAPALSPGEARAAAQGIDAGDAAALDAQVTQLAADGRLPPDLLGEYRAAVEADARAQHAADAWQAAAACILRGVST